MKKIVLFSLLINILLLFTDCKKDLIDTDSSVKLEFSTDTILFDTVFTTIGSTTQMLKVYNRHSRKINISSISLSGGSGSLFSVNINGKYTLAETDIELDANDSLLIFVKVTVNPNNQTTPLVVSDSLLFITNGNSQQVKLVAWGQDANFIVADTYVKGLPPYKIIAKENESITWSDSRPYVVYGYAVVDSTGSLSINAGVKVHFYNNSGLWIYKGGSLKVDGTKDLPVRFLGTRLEQDYKDVPGQWDRIWINEGSIDNRINYAIIKNAFIGLQTETLDNTLQVSDNQVILTNSIIENCSGFGILARNYKITAGNCLVRGCGQFTAALTRGGSYDFRNCTFANYWNYSSRQTPSVILNNYITDSEGTIIATKVLSKAYFGNCIIYGNNEEEILLDSNRTGTFKYTFEHCLLRTKLKTNNNHYKNVIVNQSPMFTDTEKNDYHLKSGSPGINKGSEEILKNNFLSTILGFDIDGNIRPSASGSVDIGVFQQK